MPPRAWVPLVTTPVWAVVVGVPAGVADWCVGAIYVAAVTMTVGVLGVCVWIGPLRGRKPRCARELDRGPADG
jgi:hypothetical protein